MEAGVFGRHRSAYEAAIILLLEEGAAHGTTVTGRGGDHLGTGGIDAEAHVTLRVDLGVLLTWLAGLAGSEVFLDDGMVDGGVKVTHDSIYILLFEVFVEEQGIVVGTYP